jgi:outer membrane protein assembly factor BamB
MEIRPAHGEVLVTRGDVVLVRAPFPAAVPDEVLFSGKATFYGIAMVRSAPPPPLPHADAAGEPMILRPADATWIEQLGTNAKLDKLPDGAIQLQAEMAAARGWAMMPLPTGQLREVVLRIEQAGPGAGIFLGKPGERPGQVVRWMQDRRNGGLCLAVRGDEDAREDNYPSVAEHYLAVNPGNNWLRLVVGSGVARCWTGSDGLHWAEIEQTLPVPLGATHLGLHHVAMSAGCGLRLVHCEVRPLDALTAMVPESVLKKAPPILDATTREMWLQQVDPSRPSDVELSVWRRAAALRTLAAGCTRIIGEPLLLDLLADLPQLDWPVDRQLRALEQASLLFDLRNTHAVVPLLVERYQQLGQALFRAGGRSPCSDIRSAFMHLPLDTKANYPLVDPQLVRLELLSHLYHAAWDDALDFCRRVRFFHHQENVPLLDWGDSLARRESLSGERASRRFAAQRSEPRASRPRGLEPAMRPKPGWAHPWIEELDKDTYNTLGEFQAILESGSADDAARLVAAMTVDATRGLARWGSDESLLVTMPVAVQHAVRSSPALREALNRNHAAIARVRIREAIAAGDVTAVRMAAVQFEPTEFATEARQWLGDRALSEGQFDLALGEYQRAARSLTEIPDALSARLRLAGAMLGLHFHGGANADVSIGERRWSAGEFDAMLAELRSSSGLAAPANAQAGASGGGAAPAALQDRSAIDSRGIRSELRLHPAPMPGNFQVQVRAAIDGPLGEAPGEEILRGLNRLKVDWAGNQIAALADDKNLFVSNRFQLAAYHLETGQRIWQAAPPGLKALRSRDWTNVAMRPVSLGNALFVRMLYGDGPILVSVDKATGRLLWAGSDWKGQWVVSDPIPRHDRLLALTLQRLDLNESILRLTAIDPESGDILAQSDLLRLSQTWHVRHVCELLPRDNGLIAVLGGVVLCCGYDGDLQWLRQHVVLPLDEESETCAQTHDRPLLHEGLLCYAQPGVRTVDCVHPETGQLRWSTLMPDIRGVVGWRAGVVVVQTDAGFSGLSEKTGQVIWTTRAAGILTVQMDGPAVGAAPATDASAWILISRTLPVDGAKKFRPQLDWLDVTTGAIRASAALPALDDEDPRLGPAIAGPNRTWVFFGRGPHDPRRELVELVRLP